MKFDYRFKKEKYIRNFFKHVNKTETCWNWMASTNHGYGNVKILKKSIRAHRYSYFIHNNEMNQDLCVLHKCDNTICVNPEHLFLGTQIENIEDMYSKNRAKPFLGAIRAKGENAGRAKLTNKQVEQIRRLKLKGKQTQKEISEKYNVSQMCISKIIKNKTYTK